MRGDSGHVVSVVGENLMKPLTSCDWLRIRKLWMRLAEEEVCNPTGVLFRLAMDNEDLADICFKVEFAIEKMLLGLEDVA